ncbi:hypothetical protein ACNPGS_20745, partial [Citrobacter portucalensis]
DIQLGFRDVNTDKMKFLFHSETNLVNADYRENRSMILSGLSLVENGSPLHKSTIKVVNLRPDTACGRHGRENWPALSAQRG